MADVTGLRSKLMARADRARVLAGAEMRTHYRTAAPYASGETQDSVDVTGFTRRGNDLVCTAVATTPQAKWTDEGTKAHTIRPRRAKALRFRVGGRIVYAKVVHHPGNRGTRWFRNTGPRHWNGALQRAFGRL